MEVIIIFIHILSVIVGGFSALVVISTIYQFGKLTPLQQYYADVTGCLKWVVVLFVCIAWWIAQIFV